MQFTLSAYIHNGATLDQVRQGKLIPLFARDEERMETSGFKRIGAARVSVELDEGQDELDARIAAAGLGVAGNIT